MWKFARFLMYLTFGDELGKRLCPDGAEAALLRLVSCCKGHPFPPDRWRFYPITSQALLYRVVETKVCFKLF